MFAAGFHGLARGLLHLPGRGGAAGGERKRGWLGPGLGQVSDKSFFIRMDLLVIFICTGGKGGYSHVKNLSRVLKS